MSIGSHGLEVGRDYELTIGASFKSGRAPDAYHLMRCKFKLAKISVYTSCTRTHAPFYYLRSSPIPEATPTESDRPIPPDSVGLGRIRSDLVGYGQTRSDSVGLGWVWLDFVRFGPILVYGKYGRIWSDSFGFGWFSSDLVWVASGDLI